MCVCDSLKNRPDARYVPPLCDPFRSPASVFRWIKTAGIKFGQYNTFATFKNCGYVLRDNTDNIEAILI